jgi:hypothetical protein
LNNSSYFVSILTIPQEKPLIFFFNVLNKLFKKFGIIEKEKIMNNKKQSSKEVSSLAARVLLNANSSEIAKGLAGSVLSQSNKKR